MTTPAQGRSLESPPAPDAAVVLFRCQTRILEREGIPMFVALHDARPGRPAPTTDGEGRQMEGDRRLAELFDHYCQRLTDFAPTRDPGDDPTGAWALIDVLVVLSDQHLRAPEDADS